jgi:hypothetical protein
MPQHNPNRFISRALIASSLLTGCQTSHDSQPVYDQRSVELAENLAGIALESLQMNPSKWQVEDIESDRDVLQILPYHIEGRSGYVKLIVGEPHSGGQYDEADVKQIEIQQTSADAVQQNIPSEYYIGVYVTDSEAHSSVGYGQDLYLSGNLTNAQFEEVSEQAINELEDVINGTFEEVVRPASLQ